VNIMKGKVGEESIRFDFDVDLRGSSPFSKMPRFVRLVLLEIS